MADTIAELPQADQETITPPFLSVENRIDIDAKNSAEMKPLIELFPDSQLASVDYEYGDTPNSNFDPITKKISITLDIDDVENEMKYMARKQPDTLKCRTTVKDKLAEMSGDESLPAVVRQSFSEIKTDLESDPTIIESGTEDFLNLSLLGFRKIQETLDTNIQDPKQKQQIYSNIYNNALLNSQFAVKRLEEKVVHIEVHERTHFSNDLVLPTQLPNIEQLNQIIDIKTDFLAENGPFQPSYESIVDKDGKELTNNELIEINHKLVDKVAPLVLNSEALRNARDEVVAVTIENLTKEKSGDLTPVTLFKYATSGLHYFDRDPNLDVDLLKQKLLEKTSAEDRKQVVIDYLKNGFDIVEQQAEEIVTK